MLKVLFVPLLRLETIDSWIICKVSLFFLSVCFDFPFISGWFVCLFRLGTTLEPELHQPCLKPLLTVQTTDSLPYVFRRLSNEGILSAPVLEGTWYIYTYIYTLNWNFFHS